MYNMYKTTVFMYVKKIENDKIEKAMLKINSAYATI